MATYQLNQTVYISGHGISTLTEVKTITVAGSTQTMMAFDVQATGVRIMVPESKSVSNCRTPAPEAVAQEALKVLTSTSGKVENKPNYKKWNRMIQETIQEGDTLALAQLVAKIDGQRAIKALPVNESRLLETAKRILGSELSFALGLSHVQSHAPMLGI